MWKCYSIGVWYGTVMCSRVVPESLDEVNLGADESSSPVPVIPKHFSDGKWNQGDQAWVASFPPSPARVALRVVGLTETDFC